MQSAAGRVVALVASVCQQGTGSVGTYVRYSLCMTEYMNVERPAFVPVKPGGEPKPIVARLVRLDGTEVRVPGRSVRYAGQTHVLVAVGTPTEYFWLRTQDVNPRTTAW